MTFYPFEVRVVSLPQLSCPERVQELVELTQNCPEIQVSFDFDIEHMSVLARIKLTPDEKTRLSGQMGTILEYIEKLKEVNTEDVEPTAHVLGLNNVFRDDEPAPKPLADHNPISDSPAHDKGHYEVPKII